MQGMGFGWIAFGYAFAFFVSLAIWNGVSAKMNPGFLLGDWILGTLDAADVFALMAAELGGAVFGACLVWLHYLPHFKTIPEPPAASVAEALLRSRDYITYDGLKCALSLTPVFVQPLLILSLQKDPCRHPV